MADYREQSEYLERYEAGTDPVVPGAIPTEDGDGDLAQAAWLGAQAVINETVQRGFWINEPGEDVLDDLSSAGFSVVEAWALNQPAASPQGEAPGQGEGARRDSCTCGHDRDSHNEGPVGELPGCLMCTTRTGGCRGFEAAAPRAVAPVDQGHVALADQWRLDADNLRNAELSKASLLTIAEHLDQAARIVGGDRP